MNAGTVSAAYLLGIREGREILNFNRADFDANPLQFSREMLASVNSVRRQGFAGDMAEFMKGERDFWRNQISKALSKGANHGAR